MKAFLMYSLLTFAVLARADETIFAKLQIDDVSNNMDSVNPNFNLVSHGEMVIDKSQVYLTLTKTMPPCPAGSFCPQIMPSMITVQFHVVNVVRTECSTRYFAESDNDLNNSLNEKLLVEDFTNSTCEATVFNSPGVITYTATQLQETAAARFVVHGGFVRP